MNQIEFKIAIIEHISVICQISEKEISQKFQEIYVEDLSTLEPKILIKVLRDIIREGPAKLPSINDIKKRCGIVPDATLEEIAANLADKIFGCIAKHGYTNEDRAKEDIGEVGWKYVQDSGGWNRFCESVTSHDMIPTLRAQCRNSLIGLHNQHSREKHEERKGLQSANKVLLTIVENL